MTNKRGRPPLNNNRIPRTVFTTQQGIDWYRQHRDYIEQCLTDGIPLVFAKAKSPPKDVEENICIN